MSAASHIPARPSARAPELTHGRSQRVATPVWTSLRDLRQHAGLSLRGLADQADTNAGLLSQLETGQRLPSPQVLAGLSQALGVDAAGWRVRVVLEHEDAAA